MMMIDEDKENDDNDNGDANIIYKSQLRGESHKGIK